MSRENVEAVRELYRGWERGDFTVGMEHFHPEVEVTSDFGVDHVTGIGLDCLRETWGEQLRNWDSWRTGDIEELTDQGERIIVVHAVHARGRRSGVAVDSRGSSVFRFRDGRIVEFTMTLRPQAALDVVARPGSGVSDARAAAVARLVDAVKRRDLGGLADVVDPAFAFDALIGAVEGTVYRGLDGMRSFLADMDAIWEGYRIEQEELHEAGERTMLVVRAYGTARASGVPLDQRLALDMRWRGDVLLRMVARDDPSRALADLGRPG